MKKWTTLFLAVWASFMSFAQAPDYNDLVILFADGNYPKLVREADKYTQKEETKNDPAPYFWMAKGLYKLSFDNGRSEEFKNAFKDAINALGSCRKKDKDQSFYAANQEFFEEVKGTLIETIENDLEAKDFRKAAGWATRVYKLSPNDVGTKFLEGACKYRNADKGGANANWKEAEKILATMGEDPQLSENDLALLRIGVIQTAECYIAAKQVDKAKALLSKVAPWFEGDELFKAKYDELAN